MERIKKTIGTIVVFVLFFLALFFLFTYSCNGIRRKSKTDKKATIKQTPFVKVKRWVDINNTTHNEYQVLLIEKQRIQLDSLSKLLKIKDKQLKSFTDLQWNFTLEDKWKIDTIYIDSSFKYTQFQWQDKWIFIKGDIGNTDSFSIKGIDSISISNYWKRKWFLGNKKHYIDISNSNPHISYSNLRSIELVDRKQKSRLSIGPYIGVGYNNLKLNRPTFSIGLSLNYQLIKL